jgi:DNA-binding MarR family transcriptional regulator
VHLADLIQGANRRLKQALEAHLKPRGFSLHQYRVLEALDAQNGLPMGDLATRLLIDGPTLTKIIDKMVASAEVYRGPDPYDRRKVLIFLSRKGADCLRDIRSLGISIQQDLVNRLGRAKAATLTSLLSELLVDPAPSYPGAATSLDPEQRSNRHARDAR